MNDSPLRSSLILAFIVQNVSVQAFRRSKSERLNAWTTFLRSIHNSAHYTHNYIFIFIYFLGFVGSVSRQTVYATSTHQEGQEQEQQPDPRPDLGALAQRRHAEVAGGRRLGHGTTTTAATTAAATTTTTTTTTTAVAPSKAATTSRFRRLNSCYSEKVTDDETAVIL